jgi:membrane protease YdiL (CAAX protease family)
VLVIVGALVAGAFWLPAELTSRKVVRSAALRFVSAVVVFMVATESMARAYRLAERDVVARPLLAPLPIAPSELLSAKSYAVRRRAVILTGPLALALVVPGTVAWHVEIAWRVAATFVAAALASDCAVSVAFLTSGLGSPSRGSPGRAPSFQIESILLILPLLSIPAAPYAWSAMVSLAFIALLRAEGQRAALACVEWFDDAADYERVPQVWRALVVLASFQAWQILAVQLTSMLPLLPASGTALSYIASAIALVVLTVYERRGTAPISFALTRGWMLALGPLLGLASGALALGYAWCLRRSGIEVPHLAAAGAGRVLLGAAIVVAAPFAEEFFFRGWLQPAVEREHAGRSPWFARGATAFAFAAIHPPLSFAPVLVLGIVTGVLFSTSRSVTPGILAHAAHNLLVLLVS